MLTMSTLDTRYVRAPVTIVVDTVPINPTLDTVQFAFMPNPPSAKPGVSDWKAAVWDTVGPANYVAQCLVGPGVGGVVLTLGVYDVWVKVIDNPEIPTQNTGLLSIQ